MRVCVRGAGGDGQCVPRSSLVASSCNAQELAVFEACAVCYNKDAAASRAVLKCRASVRTHWHQHIRTGCMPMLYGRREELSRPGMMCLFLARAVSE